MFPDLHTTITKLLGRGAQIPYPRRDKLQQLAAYVKERGGAPARLNFICTHNSRRSHLGMIWAAVAAYHFGLDHVTTYSGGTEATAFNPRAVAALERCGFQIINTGGDNPVYEVFYAADRPPLRCFSKVYDHPDNPADHFAAVMTCSDADENCPAILGADLRLPLTYEDPKVADDTAQEARRYDERTAQIGRDMLYAFSAV